MSTPSRTTRTTNFSEVVQGQPIDIKGGDDLNDLNDQKSEGGAPKKNNLEGLLAKLRNSRKGPSTSTSRHVPYCPQNLLHLDSPLHFPVDQVVQVVHGYEINDLHEREVVQGGRSGRSGPPEGPDRLAGRSGGLEDEKGEGEGTQEPASGASHQSAVVDEWGLTEAERISARSRLSPAAGGSQADEDDALEPDEWTTQSIAQDAMVAGLMAGSRADRTGIGPSKGGLYSSVSGTTGARGQSRDRDPWTEGVSHLQEMPPLEGFTPVRWERLRLDCATLLDDWGVDLRRLGWSVEDAFGINPVAPGINVSNSGLGPLLNGAKVVNMTEAMATLALQNGVRQSFTRRLQAGSVPVWTLWKGRPVLIQNHG